MSGYNLSCYNVHMTVSPELLERIPVDSFLSDKVKRELFRKSIELAFEEDLSIDGRDDITTRAIVDPKLKVKAVIYCKQENVLVAGLAMIQEIFNCIGKEAVVEALVAEGTEINTVPKAVAIIEATAQDVLTVERTLLNLLQRMSGIATTARKYVELARPYGIQILDTRKTTPGLRVFERYAVAIAGGTNHRFGLYDAVLVKDNHIQVAGSVLSAIEKVRANLPGEKIEVECSNLEQIEDCLRMKIERIMLDNMSPSMVKEAVAVIKGRCFIEVSGGINLANITEYLQPGVDAISIGALTHSVASVDLSLEVESYI
jgi:nicotinate-nucleotide pyrophosphorylase (carboxylating)